MVRGYVKYWLLTLYMPVWCVDMLLDSQPFICLYGAWICYWILNPLYACMVRGYVKYWTLNPLYTCMVRGYATGLSTFYMPVWCVDMLSTGLLTLYMPVWCVDMLLDSQPFICLYGAWICYWTLNPLYACMVRGYVKYWSLNPLYACMVRRYATGLLTLYMPVWCVDMILDSLSAPKCTLVKKSLVGLA